MKLASLLDERVIHIGGRALSRNEAIERLLDLLLQEHPELRRSRESILKLVMEREALGGTAFPGGIAIPHARLADFDDLLIAVCVPSVPVASEAGELGMIVLILTSKVGSKLYLNTLAAFMRISRDPGLFGELKAAPDAGEFLSILRRADVQVKKEVAVRDIMSPAEVRVLPATTLKELADLLYKHSTGYAPVVDEADRFVGEVNMLDLLRVGIPDYALQLGNLSFLHSFEPFEELLQREEQMTVGEIMREGDVRLDPDESLIQAAFKLEQHRRQHLPVVRDGRLLGIVSFMDILNKVLRV